MGESIRRGQTRGAGQEPLQNWYETPERARPITIQSTEVQLSQDLIHFQQKIRYHQDFQVLQGGNTFMRYTVIVPEDQAWEIDWLFIEHNHGAGTREWRVELHMTQGPVTTRGIIRSASVPSFFIMPLIGGIQSEITASNALFRPLFPLRVYAGESLQIVNTQGMISPERSDLQVRYRHIPIPNQIFPEPAGLWQQVQI